MTPRVRTAIFPVAGLGTRFLPATKATPKELLPVLDTPLIQFAMDEARDAAIERMVFVSHATKSAIERYVLDDARMRRMLVARGKPDLAESLREAALDPVSDDVVFTLQDDPKGLGHAVLCARDHVLDGPVAVILPDDLILGTPCLGEMIDAYEGGHMVATMTVGAEDVSKYGILSVTGQDGRITRASGMVEKPAPEVAPSRHAVIGRYVLDPGIFDTLHRQPPGANDEIQLTDAIADGTDITGFHFSGTRFDCGSKAGLLAATLHRAAEDPELAAVLDAFTGTASGSRTAA